MTTQTEALKLALEALEICEKDGYIPVRLTRESITTIKEALAQPEQEIVSKARYNRMRDDYNEAIELLRLAGMAAKNWNEHKLRCQLQGVDLDHNFARPEQEPTNLDEVGTGCECTNCANGMGMCQTEEAQPEQEPVAWMDAHQPWDLYKNKPQLDAVPLYTTPPQRKPLTDAEEVLQALDSCEWSLVRIAPSSWLTDEANQRMAWGVSRTLPPFCSPDGTRMWNGATAIEAIRKGKAAIEATHGIKE